MNDEELRHKVRKLKWEDGYSYAEIADYLEIKTNSLYNWLHGSYNFGSERKQHLTNIISILSGGDK